ncbi:MAG: GTPase Era [Clostridiales bacterium]|jgi:GTP-binding protein Era|nr:GTPase Era [Clostridiales bacterium]
MTPSTKPAFKSGFVSIVGRPNVGKSTLINALIGEKVAIISPKPQTTRNQIIGILNKPDHQVVFVDTPGIHKPRTKLGEFMDKTVQDAMQAIDALIVIADASRKDPQERETIRALAQRNIPKFLVLNKIDLIHPQQLLPLIAEYAEDGFDEILPMSAKTGDGVGKLMEAVLAKLPEGPKYYPDDQWTPQTERQIIAELIREQTLFLLQEEIPHGIGIEVLSMKEVSPTLTEVFADIYCERASHKGIIIGKQGKMLGTIGTKARAAIEALLGTQVMLKLWVKVRPDWRNSNADLKNLGYTDQ